MGVRAALSGQVFQGGGGVGLVCAARHRRGAPMLRGPPPSEFPGGRGHRALGLARS